MLSRIGHNKNWGKKLSEEHKNKIREWMFLNSPMRGKHHTKKAREKMSKAEKGRPSSKGMLGKKHPQEWLREKSNSMKGEKNWNWMGGITPINERLRRSLDYKLWRETIFKRDNYTCIWCGQRGGELHADHIKPWALFPELRFAIDNGRTLCKNCHLKTDTYGWSFFRKNKKS